MTELLVTEFADRARQHHPHRSIVAYSHGEEVLRYDYGRYYERVARLAGALQRLGVRPGDRVGSLCWNHYRHLELYAAVPLAGAVLHTLNLRLSAEEIAYTAGHADDRLIVADPDLMSLLDGVDPELGVVDSGDAYEALVAQGPPVTAAPERSEHDLAVLCYTSGTTGRPKGVGYTHRGLYLHTFAACLADGHAVSGRDTVLHVVPLFHANAWGVPFAATMAGAKQVLPGPHPTVGEIAQIVERERVTYLGMVPTVATDLLEYVRRTGSDFSSVRALVLGGSTPSLELIRGWEERGVPVYQGWGMTEISPMATFTRDLDPADDPGERDRRTRTQGRLLPGLQWRIVDDDGADLPWDGVASGELLVRGPWVARSYYLGEAPEGFTGGWLRTGDVASIDPDGRLRIVDRVKGPDQERWRVDQLDGAGGGAGRRPGRRRGCGGRRAAPPVAGAAARGRRPAGGVSRVGGAGAGAARGAGAAVVAARGRCAGGRPAPHECREDGQAAAAHAVRRYDR